MVNGFGAKIQTIQRDISDISFNIAFLPTDRSRAEEKHDQSHNSRKKIVGGHGRR